MKEYFQAGRRKQSQKSLCPAPVVCEYKYTLTVVLICVKRYGYILAQKLVTHRKSGLVSGWLGKVRRHIYLSLVKVKYE